VLVGVMCDVGSSGSLVAVGVGAAVVVVAVVQWRGCYTHNSFHISIAHRLRSYNRN